MTTMIEDKLDRLAQFEPTDCPVISLYLNTGPDQHGRDHFRPFVRKELPARAKTYPLRSRERESFEADMQRINEYLENQVLASSNSLALFACSGAGNLFESLQSAAPLDRHRLYVGHQPHLYPLAVLNDQYRRYAALIVDTNTARLYVFGLGKQLDKAEIHNPKLNRTQMGGWSQARYQRHVDNNYLQHAKEVVEILERAVREDRVDGILLGGDQVILPLIRDQLPAHLADLIVEEVSLDIRTPEHEVLALTTEAARKQDAKSDEERVARLLDEYRAGALGVVGARDTLKALVNGQVNELLITFDPSQLQDDILEGTEGVEAAPASQYAVAVAAAGAESAKIALAESLIQHARQTAATVTFIENTALLAAVGGVGALLRFRF